MKKLFSIFDKRVDTPSAESRKQPKIEDSVVTIGTKFVDTTKTNGRLLPINKPPEGKTVYDSISFVIYCPKHETIAVSDSVHSGEDVGLWLPFIYLPTNANRVSAIRDGLSIILSDFQTNLMAKYMEELPFDYYLIHELRYLFKYTKGWITRHMCLARLHSDKTDVLCCQQTSRIIWLSVDDVIDEIYDNFWGPELIKFCLKVCVDVSEMERYPKLKEYGIDFIHEYLPRQPLRNNKEKALKTLDVSQTDIERLYFDFIEHCFPAFFMTRYSFGEYLHKNGIQTNHLQIRQLFNATKNQSTGSFSFNELLLALALMDPRSDDCVLRIEFIFRYFDKDCDQYLNESEFRELVIGIYGFNYPESIDIKVENGLKLMNASHYGITCDEFRKSILLTDFLDISGLCRSRSSLRCLFSDLEKKELKDNSKEEQKVWPFNLFNYLSNYF